MKQNMNGGGMPQIEVIHSYTGQVKVVTYQVDLNQTSKPNMKLTQIPKTRLIITICNLLIGCLGLSC